MAPEPPIVHDVIVLHTTDLRWPRRIGDAQIFLAKLDVDTRPMPPEGDTGTVIVSPHAVERVRKLLRTR